MVIKASAAAEIRGLVEALTRGDEVEREAAIARLAVIGPRAVERLLAAFDSQRNRAARAAILRALEPIADPRALAAARAAIEAGGDPALAAIGVLRRLLESPEDPESLELLLMAALDTSAEHRLRLAAVDVLQSLSDAVRSRVAEALAADPDPLIRERLRAGSGESLAAEALWKDALSGRLADDPRPLHDLVAARASTAALNGLQKLVDAVRDRERATGEVALRAEWRALRGALHQAIALRGSRVALYDLRETLSGSSERLPASFLAALQTVGDCSLLEPIARALSRVPENDAGWRHQLALAFRAITRRERITRRHSTLKRIAVRWPGLAADLVGGPREAARSPR